MGITNPPLEQDDNWQHVNGLMVARNFLEIDNDIRYPRMDDTYGQSGIRDGDFPLLSYTHYLVSVVFGYTHWYGRLINLVVSTLGIWCFYLMVARFFNARVGLLASLVLLLSIWFAYSRTLSNDVFGVSLMMMGLYFGLSFFREHKPWQLFISILLSGLGILSCLSASIFMMVYIIPLWQNRMEWKLWVPWLLGSSLVFVAVYEWYFVWNPYLIEEYNGGYTFRTSFYEVLDNWKESLPYQLKLYGFDALKSLVLLGCTLGGLLWIVVKRQWLLYFITILLFGGHYIFFLHSQFFEDAQDSYVVSFVPVMALVAGYGLAKVKRQWLLGILLMGGMLESIVNQWDSLVVKDSERYRLELEAIADRILKPGDMVAFASDGNPQELFLSHRKGGRVSWHSINDFHLLDAMESTGFKYLFVNRNSGQMDIGVDTFYIDENYVVYDLTGFGRELTEEELQLLRERL